MIKILKDKHKLIVGLAVLWQLISVGLIATGVWSQYVSEVNLGLLAILFVFLPQVDALGLFLLSLPFMVVLPDSVIGGLPIWRLLVVWLFIVVAAKYLFVRYKNQSGSSAKAPVVKIVKFLLSELKSFWKTKLQIWDKYLFALLVLGFVSLLAARFPVHGAKQIIFIVNIYLLYLVCLLVIESGTLLKTFFYYLKLSLLITVLLGFAQYFASFFFAPYYFWQYWASLISTSYYGQALGSVLAYSNSWFSANGGGQSLRMFGILQDTHAFSVVVIFAMALWLARHKPKESVTQVLLSQTWYFWLGLVALCFAVIASGTRGVWLAMLAPAVVSAFLLVRYKAKLLVVLPLVSYVLVVVLFILSPWISQGLNLIRTFSSNDNFLQRASSIYDLNETSNVGRLEIWKSSLSYTVHHPLGTGYGNFISSITQADNQQTYEQVADQKNLRFNLPQKFITAHSLYLHVLVELGLLGLLLFGLMWLSFLKKIWQQLKLANFKVTPQTKLLINIALVIVWLLAYGLFDVTILNERVLLYLMAIIATVNILLQNKELNLDK